MSLLESLGLDCPVVQAGMGGGVAGTDEVRTLLVAGAAGAVAGTRFLLTEESRAHPGYKQRVLTADRTIRSLLFGMGWPLPYRVVPNAVTDRWCARSELGPGVVRGLNRQTAPLSRLLPMSSRGAMLTLQRVAIPLFTPAPAGRQGSGRGRPVGALRRRDHPPHTRRHPGRRGGRPAGAVTDAG